MPWETTFTKVCSFLFFSDCCVDFGFSDNFTCGTLSSLSKDLIIHMSFCFYVLDKFVERIL